MNPPSGSADTRERLIRAGVELLGEGGGLESLGLRSIARRAGVSHGAPRRHFPTHRALVAAVAAAGLADLAEEVRGPLTVPGRPPADRLTAAGVAYVTFAARRRDMFELIFRHDLLRGAGADLRATTLPLLSDLHATLTAALAPTGGDAAETEPSSTGTSGRAAWGPTIRVWTAVHGIAVLYGNQVFDLLGDAATEPGSLVAAAVDSVVAEHGR
ncbi:TetR-like C-terminal domain-containing protein [Gordonia caeni]|uniref:TetR/AcrR family transcriptional regulator n=1 Tax=Gordonia caeni TaxID=1007097 RepID=A0ABP7P0Q4_9ACTN